MDRMIAGDVPDAFAPGLADQALAPGGIVAVDLDQGAHRAWPSDLQLAGRLLIGHSDAPLDDVTAPIAARTTLTIAPGGAGRAWVGDEGCLDVIAETSASAPVAVAALARLLTVGADVSVPVALELESLTFSALLASEEFGRWRARTPSASGDGPAGQVLLRRHDDVLSVTLDRPGRHNAFDREMRDQLVAALGLARADATIRRVDLTGAGESFSSGGDLSEFGTAGDPARAHLVRLERSAGLAVHAVRDRVHANVHGACIGAGVEIPAFAGHVRAGPDAWFMLPEIGMGLIPGAGGTVSIPRRIGRWRTAYLALTTHRLDAPTALDWGLVDELG